MAKYQIKKHDYNVWILKNPFTSHYVHMFMTKRHPLFDIFDKKLHQLRESGIIKFWWDDLHRKIAERDKNAFKELFVNYLGGAGVIIITGLTFFSVTFVMELWNFKLKRGSNVEVFRERCYDVEICERKTLVLLVKCESGFIDIS